jgi:uncharacterized protein (DUF2141 family)
MKRLAFILTLVLIAAAVRADSPEATPRPTSAKSAKVRKGEVVAADPSGRLTYKTSRGDEKTAAVDTSVVPRLSGLKPGDKVVLILREEDGDETVVSLKK